MAFMRVVVCVVFFLVSYDGVLAAVETLKYNSHGRRDPFVPLIGKDRTSGAKLADITSAEDIKLQGIVTLQTGSKGAILNGEIVKEGDVFGQIAIKKISEDSVLIRLGQNEFKIKLFEEREAKP